MGCGNSTQVYTNLKQDKKIKNALSFNCQQILIQLKIKYSEFRKGRTSDHKENNIIALEEQIRNIYRGILKEKMGEVNDNKITIKQCKIQISELMLQILIEIFKFICQKSQNQQKIQNFLNQIDNFLKTLTRFLKTKYPRGQNLEAGQLAKKFRQFDATEEYQYDMLKNAGFCFKSTDNFEITKTIKLFFNKIIEQLQMWYPQFKQLISSIDPAFKIGRKISQNTSKYSKLDTGTIQIKSPQIARVLIKWMQDLSQIVLNPEGRINSKSQFKFYNNSQKESETVKFSKSDSQTSATMINNGLLNQFEKFKKKYRQDTQIQKFKLNKFSMNLTSMFNSVYLNQTELSREQMEVIKYCYFNNDFISWMVEQKLIDTIKYLCQIGQSQTQHNKTLELIKFKVNDLMRCQILGDRKKIMDVYQKFIQLQQKGQIEIIKIKNRFHTALSDAMLFFKLPKSFIICECQLVLSEQSKGQDSKKAKNIETINHFLYELQRSPFGVMGQISVFLRSKSQSVSTYCDKIKLFLIEEENIVNCLNEHKIKQKIEQLQVEPFVCNKCISYYPKFSNMMRIHSCSLCSIKVCNKCTNNNFLITEEMIFNQIKQNLGIQRKNTQPQQHIDAEIIIKTQKNQRTIGVSNLQDKIRQCFKNQKLIKMKDIFKGRKIKASDIMEYFEEHQKLAIKQEWKVYFVIATYRRKSVVFKLFKYDPQEEVIFNVYQKLQRYEKFQYIQVNDYDIFLQFDNNLWKTQLTKQKTSVINIHKNGIFIFYGQQKQNLQNFNQSNTPDEEQFLFYCKINDYYLVVDLDKSGKGNKQEGWLKRYLEQLPKVNKLRKHINLSISGLQTKQLKCFQTLQWTKLIKTLNLSSNFIIDASIILNKCIKLEELNINDNKINNLEFTTHLTELKILKASDNCLTKVTKLQHINKIQELYLSNNKLNDQFSDLIAGKQLKQQSFLTSLFSKKQTANINISQKIDHDGTYYFLSQLKRIHLSNNHITNLQFMRALNLKQLVILNNPIDNIDNFVKGYNHLNFTHLTINNLPKQKMFKLPQNLTHFLLIQGKINDSQLQQFLNFQTQDHTQLQFISFEGNKLHKAPNLSHFPNLKKLILTYNPIQNYDNILTIPFSNKVYRQLNQIQIPVKFINQTNYKELMLNFYKSFPTTQINQIKYTFEKEVTLNSQFGTKNSKNKELSEQNFISNLEEKQTNFEELLKPYTFSKNTKQNQYKRQNQIKKQNHYFYKKQSFKSTDSQGNQQAKMQQDFSSHNLLRDLQYVYSIFQSQKQVSYKYVKNPTNLYFLDHPNQLKIQTFIKYNWTLLEHLNLCGCSLEDKDWKVLVNNAHLFPRLVKLQIWQNNIKSVKKEDIKAFVSLKNIYFNGLGMNPLTEQSIKQLTLMGFYPSNISQFFGKKCRLLKKLEQITLQWKYMSIMGLGGNYKEIYRPCIYEINSVCFMFFIQKKFQVREVVILGEQLQYGLNEGSIFFIFHQKDYRKMGIYQQRFYRIDLQNMLTMTQQKNSSNIAKLLQCWKINSKSQSTWISGNALKSL